MIKKVVAWASGIVAAVTSIFFLGWLSGRKKQTQANQDSSESTNDSTPMPTGYQKTLNRRRKEYEKEKAEILKRHPDRSAGQLCALAELVKRYHDVAN